MPTIKEIAATTGFRGTSSRRTAEPVVDTKLSSVDVSSPADKNTISTSIDCYVAGEYIGRKGNSLEVRQRYQIFVKYGSSSQIQAMEQVRTRIMDDFSNRFGQFNITSVYVEPLSPVQAMPDPADDMQLYDGRDVWRTAIARASFEIGTEEEKAKRNITNIKRRYNL